MASVTIPASTGVELPRYPAATLDQLTYRAGIAARHPRSARRRYGVRAAPCIPALATRSVFAGVRSSW